ncbi:MAG: hypothetical protein KGD60_00935 [Candidatus Thorarchaeota archaeon]|nr:hypothetical protein [Candidatus Thorarchaeota archaeon]
MPARYEFSQEAIQNFSNQYGIAINLTSEQKEKLADIGKTSLLVEQISSIADQLCPDDVSLKDFIEQGLADLHPVALTLYVLNDDLWKIMSRKHEHPEKMLPMTTIPWFCWEEKAEGRKNPTGVKSIDDPNRPFTTKIEDGVLKISGKGGDFAGLLEGRIVNPYKGIRPLFIPGSTGPKKAVANYESQLIQIAINIAPSKMKLYPAPVKELDYVFSEKPRVFYDHGIQINVDGEEVNLKVGKRREITLRGKVMIFIGKDFEETPDSDKILMFHAWLAVLNRTPFL